MISIERTNGLPLQNVSFGILILSWVLRNKRLKRIFDLPALVRDSDGKACSRKGILDRKDLSGGCIPHRIPLFMDCLAGICLPRVQLCLGYL